MKKAAQIPLHTQGARAIGGIDVKAFFQKEAIKPSITSPHMDDHYIIFLVTKGELTGHFDMQDVHISGNGVVVVKPFQVHAMKSMSPDAEGYYISFESFLVPPLFSEIFNGPQPVSPFMAIDDAQKEELVTIALLIYKNFISGHPHKSFIINGLFNAYIHTVAGLFSQQVLPKNNITQNQPATITQNFKALVVKHSFLNFPSFYAQKLHITTSHLNHCLKITTGLTVTHWLQDAMITEAKKQIYYTDNDIKQIAFALGYDDHTYFARLFKKITGETPLAFRQRFRE